MIKKLLEIKLPKQPATIDRSLAVSKDDIRGKWNCCYIHHHPDGKNFCEYEKTFDTLIEALECFQDRLQLDLDFHVETMNEVRSLVSQLDFYTRD